MTRSGLNAFYQAGHEMRALQQLLDEGVTPLQRLFSLLLRYRL
jgi:hypothetical protein